MQNDLATKCTSARHACIPHGCCCWSQEASRRAAEHAWQAIIRRTTMGSDTTGIGNSATEACKHTAVDPDFAPVSDDGARPDETTHLLLHASDNGNSLRQLQEHPSSSLSGDMAVARSEEYRKPIRSDVVDDKTTADVLPVDCNTSLLDTNYNFDPNAVGASAPAGPSGSVHGISLHQFFFPRYNPTIQRYYRFTASSETPFAALHKRPGSDGRSGGSVSGTSTAANNSGVTGLLRRSAGKYCVLY